MFGLSTAILAAVIDDTPRSAGTAVAAVLQTVGYARQASLIDHLDSFMMSGGALLYFVSCTGGLIAIVLFGSFRMTRYLLIGPTLFYLLVFIRAEVPGVVVKRGTSETAQVAYACTDELEGLCLKEGETVKVAWFFKWYTDVISEIVQGLRHVILNSTDPVELGKLARHKALDLIVNSKSTNGDYHMMIKEAMFGQCQPAFENLIGLSSPMYSSHRINTLRGLSQREEGEASPGAAEMAKNAEDVRLQGLKALNKNLKARVSPSNRFKQYIVEKQEAHNDGSPSGINYSEILPNTNDKSYGNPQLFLSDYVNTPRFSLSCEQVILIVKDKIIDEAERLVVQIQSSIFTVDGDSDKLGVNGLKNDPERQELLCREISRKMYGQDYYDEYLQDLGSDNVNGEIYTAGTCSLVPVVSLYLLRDIVSESFYVGADRMNKVIDRFQLKSGISGLRKQDPSPDKAIAPFFEDGEEVLDKRTKYHTRYGFRTGLEGLSEGFSMDRGDIYNYITNEACVGTKEHCRNNAEEWHPYLRVSIPGQDSTTFKSFLNQRRLDYSQQIYSYTMNIPHWQGTFFFCLSACYPFFVIIVVVPSRAAIFVFVPLAWLWVESWDIGFALIEIFNRVLWELIPGVNANMDKFNVQSGEGGDFIENAPALLSAVLAVDPTFDASQQSYYVSAATAAVPAIMGYAIFKSGYRALASFDYAMQIISTTAGDLAAGGFSIGKMTERHRDQEDLLAGIYSSVSKGKGGLFGHGRADIAKGMGITGLQANILNTIAGSVKLDDLPGSISKLLKGKSLEGVGQTTIQTLLAGIRRYRVVALQSVQTAAAYRTFIDGVHSIEAIANSAGKYSLDTAGDKSFELQIAAALDNSMGERVNLHHAVVREEYKISRGLFRTAAKHTPGVSSRVVGAAATASGLSRSVNRRYVIGDDMSYLLSKLAASLDTSAAAENFRVDPNDRLNDPNILKRARRLRIAKGNLDREIRIAFKKAVDAGVLFRKVAEAKDKEDRKKS